jgi:hypothetical protein
MTDPALAATATPLLEVVDLAKLFPIKSGLLGVPSTACHFR